MKWCDTLLCSLKKTCIGILVIFVSQTGVFKQSKWEENRFIVSDRFGKVFAVIIV